MFTLPARWRIALNREMRRWHWISAAVSLFAVLLFSVTGVTLNHAGSIPAEPRTTTREMVLPLDLQELLAGSSMQTGEPLPGRLHDWLEQTLDISLGTSRAEWSDAEVYVSLPSPGADAWLAIDRTNGSLQYEHTDRGWIAFFNDVHKGRHTGAVWRAFIDLVAVACIVFALSGLVLLQLAARQRKATWPVVGGGVLLVSVLLMFFVH